MVSTRSATKNIKEKYFPTLEVKEEREISNDATPTTNPNRILDMEEEVEIPSSSNDDFSSLPLKIEYEEVPSISIRKEMVKPKHKNGLRFDYVKEEKKDGTKEKQQEVDDVSVVRIRVRPNYLTKDLFSRCISQALGFDLSKAYQTVDVDSEIEGMFRERDGLFIPLVDILHFPSEYESDTFRLSPPAASPRSHSFIGSSSSSPTQENQENRSKSVVCFLTIATLLLIFVIFLGDPHALLCGECFMEQVIAPWNIFVTIVKWFDRVFVEAPLENMYRYGPSLLGWEGAPLNSICAQITYYGDEAFWLQNMETCKTTYLNKVAAMMYVRKPILYLFVSVVAFALANAVIVLRRNMRPDKDMEETFKALSIIVRQVKKAIKKE